MLLPLSISPVLHYWEADSFLQTHSPLQLLSTTKRAKNHWCPNSLKLPFFQKNTHKGTLQQPLEFLIYLRDQYLNTIFNSIFYQHSHPTLKYCSNVLWHVISDSFPTHHGGIQTYKNGTVWTNIFLLYYSFQSYVSFILSNKLVFNMEESK